MRKHHQNKSLAKTKIQCLKQGLSIVNMLVHNKNKSTVISSVQLLSLFKREQSHQSQHLLPRQTAAFTVLHNWQAWRWYSLRWQKQCGGIHLVFIEPLDIF